MAKHNLTGKRFAHYNLVRLLGRGGMADVYLADDTRLHRQVALKILPPEFARDEERARRFDKEIRATAGLDHPHITTVYEVGEFDGLHYYTMSLLTGGELKQRIAAGMSEQDAARVLREITTALGYAHTKGFIHRDIKPENILFHEDGRSCLTDLGIALAAGSGTRMTATGMSIGTPHYMSPEQCQGEHDLDGRSDLYSLGIVFYEMLTGRVPYDAANTVGIVMKHVQEPIPTLPPPLARYQYILNGLLAKYRNNRFSSATELIRAIDTVQSDTHAQALRYKYESPSKTTVITTPPRPAAVQRQSVLEKPAEPSTPQSTSLGIVWALGGAALATVIAFGAWSYYQAKPAIQRDGDTLPLVQVPTMLQSTSKSKFAEQDAEAVSALEKQLAPSTTPKTGIQIIPNPVTSKIYFDGVFAGSGLLDISDLSEGQSVMLRAEAEGYQPLEKIVRVSSGRIQQVDMSLQKVIAKYALTIEPVPGDARIQILNHEVGYKAGMLLEPGKYQIEVSKPGYVAETRWVEISGQALREHVLLQKANYAVTIKVSPDNALVRLLEPIRDYRPGMLLAPGNYRYEALALGFKAYQGVVKLTDHDVIERVELVSQWTAGQVFKDCSNCPEMVVIPAGSVQVGSPLSEKYRDNDEGPQHWVTINQPFALGKTEITVGEFRRFVTSSGYQTEAEKDSEGCYVFSGGRWGMLGSVDWQNPGFSQDDSSPVVCISWVDVAAYVNWLAKTTGESYRLPTEAEWEYAARAGTTSAYWWGNSVTCSQVVHISPECHGSKTLAVGSYQANDFGLFDVHGSVWEWTEDCWNKSYSGAPNDGSAWTEGDCSRRVLRGGSWANYPSDLRAANREWNLPSNRYSSIGFRLARTL